MKRARRARCVACGRPIGATFASTPVHSVACGHMLALRIVASIPGVLDLLPAEWRADLAGKRIPTERDERLIRAGLMEPLT